MNSGASRKRRVCVVVTNRATYARIKALLRAVQRHPDLELQLILSASMLLQRFGHAEAVVRADGFEPVATVHCVVEGSTPSAMAKTTGLAIMELGSLFERLQPDIVVTIADRFETLATAVAATYLNLPLVHTQGGEVTGSIDESVRHAITKLAHLHFPATELAKRNIIRMGEPPGSVHMTGCPSIDAIEAIDLSPPDMKFFERAGVGGSIDMRSAYLLVLQHPVTTEYASAEQQVRATLDAVNRSKLPAIWMWPNMDAGSDAVSKVLRQFREMNREAKFHFFTNLAVEEFARVLNNPACIIGNSSSALREGAFLGTPAVNIGSRQSGRERGENVIDVGHNADEILAAIQRQVAHGRYPKNILFGDGRAAERMVEILATAQVSIQKRLSYTD